MPLQDCLCVAGKPISEQLVAIYCALLEIVQNGGGGSVNINDVEGVSDFWKATLSGTPAANQVFGTDGSGVFTTFDVTSTGQLFLNIAPPDPDNSFFIILQGTGSLDTQQVGPSSTVNPVTEVTVSQGIVTAIS